MALPRRRLEVSQRRSQVSDGSERVVHLRSGRRARDSATAFRLRTCDGLLERHVLFRPYRDRFNRCREPPPLHAERVLDANRRVWNDGPLHDAFLLELVKPFAEHPISDVWNGFAQDGESAARAHEDVEDGAGPPPTDELTGVVELPAELRRVRALISCHAIRIAPSLKICNLLLDIYELLLV